MELTQNLKRETVAHLRPRPALSLQSGQTVREAIALMQEHRKGCVLVCDENGRACGIFTERDLLRSVIGEQVDFDSPIKRVMSADLATVKASDPITRAVHLFHERGVRHLPVVDDNGAASGVLSVKRVVEYLVEHCPEAVYNLPPNPSASMESREGA